VSDPYSFSTDGDTAALPDAQRRRLLRQQLQQAASATPGQTTIAEKRIRGATRSFGTDTPALLLGGGLATPGVRSGVTLAEQELPGLLETIRAPLNSVAHVADVNHITPRETIGFIANNLETWFRTLSTRYTQPTSRMRCVYQICRALRIMRYSRSLPIRALPHSETWRKTGAMRSGAKRKRPRSKV
jgi:hypothetical protein